MPFENNTRSAALNWWWWCGAHCGAGYVVVAFGLRNICMVDDDEKVMKKFRFSGVTYIKVDVSGTYIQKRGCL